MSFTITLTHDVDAYYPINRFNVIKQAVDSLDFRELWPAISETANPFDTFDRILRLEKEYGARSTYFFLTNRGDQNSDYSFFDPPVRDMIGRLESEGNEIGLHGGKGSHNNLKLLKSEVASLEAVTTNPVESIRNHGHWLDKIPTKTFEFQRMAGFKYDCTYIPQSFGRSRVFEPFQAVDGLIEIPTAFCDRDYQDAVNIQGVEETWERLEKVLDEYRKNEGLCCISWHPHAFYANEDVGSRLFYHDFNGFGDLYRRILCYGNEHGATMVPVREATDFYDIGNPRW